MTAWNRNTAKAEALVELGLDFKAAQHEAVEECDVAVLFLADADAIESILFSNPRALKALRGKTVLQMGTIGESTPGQRQAIQVGSIDHLRGKNEYQWTKSHLSVCSGQGSVCQHQPHQQFG